MYSNKANDIHVESQESQTPWLSIIIPIYNAEKYLRQCLDSIIMQTFTNFEVLLIDDGSKDSSPDICQVYTKRNSRFRYFRKENGGAYQSRIYGAERATGTYVVFCDADDYYASKRSFARLFEVISKTNCSALQFGTIKKYNHLGKKCSSVKAPLLVNKNNFLSEEYPKLLCSFWERAHLTTNVHSKVYNRKLFANLPSSDSAERIFWGDDLILNLHLLSTCESFLFIPDALYCYRQFSGGTNRFSKRSMEDLDNIKKYQLLWLERYHGSASKEVILNILFSEISGWFFVYIQQALDHLSKEELIALINEVLVYPRFKLAQEYYTKESTESRLAVNLLREADADRYIEKAIEYRNKKSAKNTLKEIFKKIYASM